VLKKGAGDQQRRVGFEARSGLPRSAETHGNRRWELQCRGFQRFAASRFALRNPPYVGIDYVLAARHEQAGCLRSQPASDTTLSSTL